MRLRVLTLLVAVGCGGCTMHHTHEHSWPKGKLRCGPTLIGGFECESGATPTTCPKEPSAADGTEVVDEP